MQDSKIKLGVASDIWSLGIILYEMIYNVTPFASISNVSQKIRSIVSEKYEIDYKPVDNEHVIDVMKQCLQRDPKKRATIEQLLDHPFLISD